MEAKNIAIDITKDSYFEIIFLILILFSLYLTSLYSYLLFHSLIELSSIVVAWSIFVIAWLSRHFTQNKYFLVLGIAYFFIGTLDLIHTLAYKGMWVFQGYDADLPTQVWIAARYLQAFSFVVAPFLIDKKIKAVPVFLSYFIIFLLVLMSIFYWGVFPVCFKEVTGLTPFKKISEYIISFLFLASGLILYGKRQHFEKRVLSFLYGAIALAILSEISFTFYIQVYGLSNLVGHIFKVLSVYLIYKAIIETGFLKPYHLIFKDLKESEQNLRQREHFLASVLRSIQDGIVVLDNAFTIVQVNQTMERWYPQAVPLVGKKCYEAFHGRDEPCEICPTAETLATGAASYKDIHKPAIDGRAEGWLAVFSFPFVESDSGEMTGVIEYLRDITERKRTDEALRWELAVNAALAQLYKPLVTPFSSMVEISSYVLEQAKKLTTSKYGYVSPLDQGNGDIIRNTSAEMMQDLGQTEEKEHRIVVPWGLDGQSPELPGHALNTGEAFYTNSPATHAASSGVPDGHLSIDRFLTVPVKLGNELVGQISLANPDRDYTDQDLKAVKRLSEYFALAIQKKGFEEALQRAHDELEIKVKHRTAELAQSNVQLMKEISERLKFEEDLRESEQKLRDLTSQLLNAQEQERKRVSRELHDELGQSLLVLKMQIRAQERSLSSDQHLLNENCAQAIHHLDDIIDNVRRLSRDLSPAILEDLGLKAALQSLFDSFGTHYGVKEFAMHLDDVQDLFPLEAQINIYRVFQESLTNIGKYAHPTRVAAAVKRDDGEVFFLVEDDGVGFDLAKMLAKDTREKGLGLAAMEERVRILGGSLQVWSQEGLGTRISFRLPVA